MRNFLTIWAGQVISLIGSGMTTFALGLWIYEQSGEAMPFVLIALFNSIPPFLVSPFAGVLVDRFSRRSVMLASDAGSAAITMALLLLFSTGRLELWHLYLAALLNSALGIFQLLAYQAIVTNLVPQQQYGRANALVQTAQSVSAILSPLAAAALYGSLGLATIFGLDLGGFVVAVAALLLVRISEPKLEGNRRNSLWADMRIGFDFIRSRQGLIGLAVFIALLNLVLSASTVLVTPMVLGFASAQVLAAMQSVSGVGLLLGGVYASTWSNPRRKVLAIVVCAIVSGLGLATAGLRPSPVLIAAGFFIFLFPITSINATLRAIVQAKVPANLQGRVFSLIVMTARAGIPFSLLLAGPLADRVFEPAMALGGALGAGALGRLLSTGPGRGIGLMLLLSGLGMVAVSLVMYATPRLRRVEHELPDANED